MTEPSNIRPIPTAGAFVRAVYEAAAAKQRLVDDEERCARIREMLQPLNPERSA
jgi:hypothetical protein